MRDRRLLVAAAAILVIGTLSARHPTADIRLLTHEAADPSPMRMQAAIDLGVVGVSLIYTLTRHIR